METRNKNVEVTKAITPPVTPAKNAKYIFFVLLLIMLFATIVIIWQRSESINNEESSDNSSKEESAQVYSSSSSKKQSTYTTSYDMAKVDYESILVLKIKPSERILVNTTKGWNPIWSDGPIGVYCSDQHERTLEGNMFTSGPESFKGAGIWFIFHNDSNKIITVKVGRCRSKTDCNISF